MSRRRLLPCSQSFGAVYPHPVPARSLAVTVGLSRTTRPGSGEPQVAFIPGIRLWLFSQRRLPPPGPGPGRTGPSRARHRAGNAPAARPGGRAGRAPCGAPGHHHAGGDARHRRGPPARRWSTPLPERSGQGPTGGRPARRPPARPSSRLELSAFRGAFAALPSGSLALNDVRTPEFVIHEDRRVVAYYAPLGYLNRHATWPGGVTPDPTQMLKSFTVVRSYLVPGPPFGEARKLSWAAGGGCPGSRRS